MNNFLKNIVLRHHLKPSNLVMPRVKSIFEQEKNNLFQNPENGFDKQQAPVEDGNEMPVLSNVLRNMKADPITKTNHQKMVMEDPDVSTNEVEMKPGADDTMQINKEVQKNIRAGNDPDKKEELKDDKLKPAIKSTTSTADLPFIDTDENAGLNNNNSAGRHWPLPLGKLSTDAIKITAPFPQQYNENEVVAEHIDNKQKPASDALSWVKSFKGSMGNNEAVSKEPAQIIKINIGRIDVRAITPSTPVRAKVEPRPGLSLDDFLKKKNSMPS